MKHRIYKIALLISAALCTISCEDFLDQSPETGISTEEVYSNYTTFEQSVDYAYSLIYNYLVDDDLALGGGFCDEGTMTQAKNAMVTNVNSGTWLNKSNSELGITSLSPAYNATMAIRAVNLALENADLLTTYPGETAMYGVTTEESKVEMKNHLLGQCYFLRAWHYFQIIMRYGGMPELRTSFTAVTDFDISRPTYAESTQWLVEDLDKAIELLPEKYTSSTGVVLYKVRATKTTAKVLKAMALLYSASPTMSGNSKGVYDKELLAEAFEASKEAIAAYEACGGYYKMYDWESYSDNFYSTNLLGVNDEAIFQAPVDSDQQAGVKMGQGWTLPSWDGGWAYMLVPTQNAVDRFGTIDGLMLLTKEDRDYAASVGSYDPQDPYSNRDPRLAFDIYCHGAEYNHNAVTSTSSYKKSDSYVNKNLYFDGRRSGVFFDQLSTSTETFSGYYHKKFRWKNNCKAGGSAANYGVCAYIRVPQIYLDFAEISNELYGPTTKGDGAKYSAEEAINVVRDRVEADPKFDVNSLYTTDTDTFREFIYTERGVELFSEGHRWHDIRRWGIMDIFKNSTSCLYGANITGTYESPVYGEPIPLTGLVQRNYTDIHYWYPFPDSIINMMFIFEQNPGW